MIPDASLPDCPQCGTTIRQAERVGVSAAVEPCRHFIPAEFFKPRHVESAVAKELVADGGSERRDPTDDPRACSRCGVHIGIFPREEYCDPCARELGVEPPMERCLECGQDAPRDRMSSIDISPSDEYYPTVRYLCPACSGGEPA